VGLNSPQAPVASHLSVSEVEKKERAGHYTGSWEQQSSSPPCTPFSNKILQEILQKLPVNMEKKAPNFANLFSSGKGLNFQKKIAK
jgi:hypothetical protein